MVTNTAAIKLYNGDGETTRFPITLEHTSEDDIKVESISDETGAYTELVKGTDWAYTVDGEAIYCDLTIALSSGYKLMLSLDIPGTQPVHLIEGAPYVPNVLENALDRFTLRDNQILSLLKGAITAPQEESQDDMRLPTAESRAGSFLYFDPEGKPSVDPNVTAKPTTAFTEALLRKENVTEFNEALAGPRYYVQGRISDQAKVSGALMISGWHTIGIVAAGATIPYMSELNCALYGSFREDVAGCIVGGATHISAAKRQYIKLKEPAYWNDVHLGLKGFRLAYSDITNSGAKIQAKVDVYTGASAYLTTRLAQNLSNTATKKGVEIVSPYLDDESINPSGQVILPDGETPASFLEAGAEYADNGPDFAHSNSRVTAIAATNDQLRVTVDTPYIPKQNATNVNLSGWNCNFFDTNNKGSEALGTFTTTLSKVKEDGFIFLIEQTGIATELLKYRPLQIVINVDNFKITLL